MWLMCSCAHPWGICERLWDARLESAACLSHHLAVAAGRACALGGFLTEGLQWFPGTAVQGTRRRVA